METDTNTTKKTVQNNPFLIPIRWINFLGLSVMLLFSLPKVIVRIFNLGIESQLTAGGFMYLNFYILFLFSFWFFLLFMKNEQRYRQKNKIDFKEHITSNWLIFCGHLFPVIIFFIMFCF